MPDAVDGIASYYMRIFGELKLPARHSEGTIMLLGSSHQRSGSTSSIMQFALVMVCLASMACDRRERSEMPPSNVWARQSTATNKAPSGTDPRLGSVDRSPIVDLKSPTMRRTLADTDNAEPRTLHRVRLFGDSSTFGRVAAVGLFGPYLVVLDRLTSPHLLVLEYHSGKLLRRFGKHGRGPKEFQGPDWLFPVTGKPLHALVYYFNQRRVTEIDLAANDPDRTVVSQNSLNYGVTIDRPVFGDSTIVTGGLFPGYSLLILDRQSGKAERVKGEPPFSGSRISLPIAKRLLNRSFLVYAPDLSRVALVYQFTPKVDLFTFNGQHYASAKGPRQTVPKYHIADGRFFWDAGNQMAYSSAAADHNYIYAVYSGCKLEQACPDSRLHVFNWSGKFVAELTFDSEVFSINVSPDGMHLFGGIEDPYPRVAEYRLPPL
ncbi:MAG: BF3164 family lipoprotein [Gemmatimonadota bacterium]